MDLNGFIKRWRFTLLLAGAVSTGAVVGAVMGPDACMFKPFGDVFLNLLFSAAVPLVFFSIASAVASSSNLKRLGRIAALMLIVFLLTGIIASSLMLVAMKVFNPTEGLTLQFGSLSASDTDGWTEKIAGAFTVNDFSGLLSRQNILALIVFSLLTGLASQAAGEKGCLFREFLISGTSVMGALIRLIMFYAPIGLGAYFAYLAGKFGSELVGTYLRVALLYYPAALLYFGLGFTVYVFGAGGKDYIRRFWTHIPPAALTAWGTGSSLAALPANMEAARRIGVPEDIREIVLPLGATIHMDGTCLAAIVKIAVLFSLYGRPFTGLDTYITAIGVSILCGVVMSGIPGGGFLGEVLIVSIYGFGPEALPIISMLGTLVDPPATMVNSSGDTVAAMIVWSWLDRREQRQSKRPEPC